MQKSGLPRGVWFAFFSVALFSPPLVRAQNNEPDKVKFETTDGVELHGLFYTSTQGKKAPCVLFLPKIGSDMSKDGWDSLATALQKKGYAVLSFDYRGVGKSTDVAKEFWDFNFNQTRVSGYVAGKPKTSITFKDYKEGYWPYLVNDIAAAKAFLDRKNDSGECNSSNLILIGAEDGASLGALWMASEWFRYQVASPIPLKLEANPEGRDVLCGLWLSISPKLGNSSANIPTLLKLVAGRDKKVPMGFLYGDDDEKGGEYAKHICESLNRYSKDNKLCANSAVSKGGQLTGSGLLLAKLKTEDMIVKYIETTIKEKNLQDYQEHKMEKSAYYWNFGGGLRGIVQAKEPGEKAVKPIPWDVVIGLPAP
jgi:hypothetical protein